MPDIEELRRLLADRERQLAIIRTSKGMRDTNPARIALDNLEPRIIAALPALLAERDEMLAASREVWTSIPGTRDDDDPQVMRHAKALNALGSIIAKHAAKEPCS